MRSSRRGKYCFAIRSRASSSQANSFFDSTVHFNLAYKPQFVYNDSKNGQKVFAAIEGELLRCGRFAMRGINKRGWRTIVLSGADSEAVRADAIERLTSDSSSKEDDCLGYIIAVDIFSEGADIVEVNQIIMLRPTQSPIVFIRQLGRGLTKTAGKYRK